MSRQREGQNADSLHSGQIYYTHALLQARQLLVQVHALERIATYRREGVLRSELSKTLGMDAKAFHYVATVSSLLLHIW